jgi:nucleotide-binding universal stress UspA family protein
MHKLLVPFDGSESALRAVRYAIALARENGPISIHVVTAHEEPVVYGEIAVYVTRDRMVELQRQHSAAVMAPAEVLLEKASVPYTKEILVGRVAEVIARRADELGCDGIVMGTRGMTAIGNLVIGSVATKVVHVASVPVTLVK